MTASEDLPLPVYPAIRPNLVTVEIDHAKQSVVVFGDGRMLLNLRPRKGVKVVITKPIRLVDTITYLATALAIGVVLGVALYTLKGVW